LCRRAHVGVDSKMKIIHSVVVTSRQHRRFSGSAGFVAR
jgi:hypothetical protein